MNISEAVRKAQEDNKYIVRPKFLNIKIRPTNNPECCIVYKKNKPSSKRCNPKAEDLTAEDWTIVD